MTEEKKKKKLKIVKKKIEEKKIENYLCVKKMRRKENLCIYRYRYR